MDCFTGQKRILKTGEEVQDYYFVKWFSDPDEQQKNNLAEILGATHIFSETPNFLVLPRVGTISPWSSKATDILTISGVEGLKRIEKGLAYFVNELSNIDYSLYHDRMTETIIHDVKDAHVLFSESQKKQAKKILLLENGKIELEKINNALGLALSDEEIEYLYDAYKTLKRNPTHAELMMFGQVNSEHCRHKIFNAEWTIDGEKQEHSLFSMIKNTYSSNKILSAYHDNGAIISGHTCKRFLCDPETHQYTYKKEPIHTVIKVETHNHPTAISPFPGAATGSGGEIRDEGATGRGAKPKAGLCGFTVSNLHISNFSQPWEYENGKPNHIASPLEIMIHGPVGAASFNNEFGRPNICGYFRTFEQDSVGYHKPIMIAGGMGNIREQHIEKQKFSEGALLIVLGGPAMHIGLGGGAASSMHAGTSDTALDFASVQRSNPEMQRRCQEVINTCWSMGDDNPILFIHDVGAGGLSNALPELIHDNDLGGEFFLRKIPNAEPGMLPMAIWCNEAQERYVLAIDSDKIGVFERICQRERCIFSVVGQAKSQQQLILQDENFNEPVVDLPMSVLFAKPPKLKKVANKIKIKAQHFDTSKINLSEAINRVLQFPSVASKQFLITIADRSVGGLVARDQMVGPWQVPVADVGVTASGFHAYTGEAMAMGERTPLSLLDAKASARMAVAEAITNIAAARIAQLSDIKLSANWMAAAGDETQDSDLFAAVHAVGMELCPALGVAIPVGKDSLSMRMQWDNKKVTSPVSLIISAFSPVEDIRKTLTPELKSEGDLLLIDLGQGKNRLGASALAQVYGQLGDSAPDVDDAELLIHFFNSIQHLNKEDLILAYHDRSDGGVFTSLVEMAFASHVGLDVFIEKDDILRALFSEELGAVVQVNNVKKAMNVFKKYQLENCVSVIARINSRDKICILNNNVEIYSEERVKLQKIWSETSYQIQRLRDNPECAQQEFDKIDNDQPLYANLSFKIEAPQIITGVKPKVAILREQGVNGHMEMAAAFDRVGFECIDVHMTDIINGSKQLNAFVGLAACGGFSYGDVLGAGRGWASAILHNSRVRDEFEEFFHRDNTFTLGVCNGCQMLSHLKNLIPGAGHFPNFEKNMSDQFESRLSLVKIEKSPSVFFNEMAGSEIPIVVAHGEGRVTQSTDLVAMRYVGDTYPYNPNGSLEGVAGVTSKDGRVTIMMPHPERVFRTVQLSWHPADWPEYSPWIKMFANARKWV